jgi:hypothetical protein
MSNTDMLVVSSLCARLSDLSSVPYMLSFDFIFILQTSQQWSWGVGVGESIGDCTATYEPYETKTRIQRTQPTTYYSICACQEFGSGLRPYVLPCDTVGQGVPRAHAVCCMCMSMVCCIIYIRHA